MKFGLLLSVFVLFSCSSARQQWMGESTVDDDVFSREQAERILGVAVDGPRITYTAEGDSAVHDLIWSFRERTNEEASRTDGRILAFLNVADDSATNAKQFASIIPKSGWSDFNPVVGVGDEAYLKTWSYQFVLFARKGPYTVNFNVLRTKQASVEELIRVAGEVVGRLNRD